MLAVGPLFLHECVCAEPIKMHTRRNAFDYQKTKLLQLLKFSLGLELLREKLCTKTKTTNNDVEGNTGQTWRSNMDMALSNPRTCPKTELNNIN